MSGGLYRSKIVVDMAPALIQAAKRATVSVGRTDVRAAAARMVSSVGKMARQSDQDLYLASVTFFEESLLHAEDAGMVCTQLMYLHKFLVPPAVLALLMRPGGVCWIVRTFGAMLSQHTVQEFFDVLLASNPRDFFRELLPQAAAFVSHLRGTQPSGQPGGLAWMPFVEKLSSSEAARQLSFSLTLLLSAVQKTKDYDTSQLLSLGELVGGMAKVSLQNFPTLHLYAIATVWQIDEHARRKGRSVPQCMEVGMGLICSAIETEGTSATVVKYCFGALVNMASQGLPVGTPEDLDRVVSACCLYTCSGASNTAPAVQIIASLLRAGGRSLSGSVVVDVFLAARHLALVSEKMPEACLLLEQSYPLLQTPLHNVPTPEGKLSVVLSQLPASGVFDDQQFSGVMARLRLRNASAGLTKEWSRTLFFSCRIPTLLRLLDAEQWTRSKIDAHLGAGVLNRWVVEEAAKFCVTSKLRTPLGDPMQTLEAIEGMLLEADKDCGISEGVKQSTLRDLLLFVDAMEKHILMASEGCGASRGVMIPSDRLEELREDATGVRSTKRAGASASEVFFSANRKVCVDWFSRMRQGLLLASLTSGEPYEIVRHSSQRLKDILRGSHGGKNAEEVRTNLETTLLTLSSALVNIREPDAITGLLEYFCSSKRPGQMFSKLLGKEAADGFATLLRSQSLKAASMFETAASEMMPLISSSATVQQSKEVVQFILEESLDCYKNLSDWSSLDQWQEARESTGIEISLPDVELVKCLRALDSGVATECLSHVESSPAFLGQSEAISFCERMLVRSLSGAERHTADLKAVQEVCLARLRILADAMASREYETLSIFSHLSSSLLVKEQRNDTSDTLLPTAPFQGHSLYEPFAAQWVERCFGGTLEREIPRLVSQAHHSGNAAYASRLTAMLPAASFERPMLEVESLQGSFEEETKAILAALSTYASLDADADMDSAELENRRSKLFSMLAARLCAAKADECDPSDLLSLLKDDESFSSGESCDEADLSSFIASSFEHAVATSNPSLTACFSFAQWSWRQGKELMNDEGLDDEATAELEAAFNGASIPDESISSIVLSAVEEALCEWRSTPSADLPTTADFEERLRSMGATEQMLSGDDFTTVSTKAHTALAHAVQRRVAHHRGAGKHYFQALQLIDSSESEAMDRSEVQLTSCLQLLRLMTEAWPLHDEFTEAIKATPAAAWLQVLPQIIARLSHPDVSVRQLLGELLSRIAESFPQDVIFPVVVRLDMERTKEEASGYAQEWLQKIADNLGAGHPKLYSQVQNFVRELTRVTLLWHEEGYALLSKVQSQDWECRVRAITEVSDVLSRRVLAGELDNASAEDLLWQKYGAIMEHVIDRLSAFELVISRAPETPLEVQFQKSFLDRFQTALATLCSPLEPSEPEQCWTAFEELAVEFGRLQKPSQLKLSMLSPGLGKFTSSDIEMPTSHASPDGSVTIAKIEERVVVIATKTKPKKLQFRGSDGKAYHYLLKGREDLNLDARIMQFFTAVNGLLRNSSKPYSVVQRKLRARNYAVVPLAERSGLIQWVEGQVSLFQVWKQWQTNNVAVEAAANPSSAPPAQQRPTEIFYSHLAPALAAHNDSLSESCDRRRAVDATPAGRKDWPHSVLKSVFLSLKADSPADLLAQELWCSSASNAGWWQKQKDFAQSLAVTSMIGYCLGVGDRHLDNILLDACSGEVLHIDFNVCFDRGSKLRVPETVPFRLTQLLERGLGVTGVAGAFKESSKITLQTLRDHRHMLLALLEVFVYEPLTEWTQSKSALRHRSKVELAVALEHLSAKVELTTQTMHESIAELGTAFKSYVEEFCAVVDERGGPGEVSALRAPTEEEAAAAVEQTTRLPEEEEEADLGKAREEDEEEEEESLEVLLEDLQACEQEVEEYVRLMADSRLRFRELTAGAPKQLLESCQSEQARLEKSLEVVHGRHLFMLREYLQKTQSVALLVSLQRLYARQPPPAAIAGQDAFAERILSERLIAADKNSLECIRILLRVAEITKGAQPQYRLRNRCHDWIQVLTKALDTEALSDNEIDDLNLSRSLEGEKAALATYLDAAEAHSEQLQSLALLEETVSEAEAKKALNATKVEEAMSLLVNHNIEVVHSNSGVQVVGLVRLIDLSARLRSVIQENGSIATASDDSSFASAGDDCDQKLVDAVSDITASVGLIMDVQRQHFEGWQKGCVPPPWTAAWQVGSEDVRRSVLEMTSADFDLEDFHLIAPPTVQQLVSIQKGLAENLDLLIKLEELDFVAHQKLSTAENFLATSGTVRPGGMPKSHWQQQRRQAREEVAVISARNTTLQRSVNSLIARVETLFAANQQEPSFAALFSLFPRLEAAFSKFVVFLKTVGVNHRPLLQQKLFYCSKIDLLLTLHGASAECANDPRTALLQQARAKRGIFSFVKKFLCTLFAPLSEGMLALVVKGYTKSVAPSVEPDATPEQVREFLFLNYGRTIEWDAIETAFSLVLSGKAFNEECEREIRSAEEALTIANGEAEEMRQRQLAVEVIYEDALVQNVKGFKPQIAPLLNELEREVRQLQQVATLGPLVNKYLQRVQELVTTNAQALPAGAVAEMQQRAQCLMLRVRDLTGFLQVAAAVMHFESLRCSSSSVTRSFEERVLAVVRPLRDQLKEVQGTAAGAQAAEERLRVAQEEFRLLKEAREKEEREKEREKEEKRRQEEERQQKERERLEKERLAKEEQQRAVSEDNTPQSSEPQSHLGIAKERLQKQLASFWAITGEELDSLLRKVSRQYDALEDSALERVAAVASSARSEQREVNETFAAFLSASSPLLKSTSASPEDLSAAKATAKEMSSAEPIATLRQFHGNFTELGPLANALHARWLASPAKEDPTSPAGANASAQPAKKQRQNLYALGVLKRVRSKLQGRVAGGKQRLPVASQVDHVIDQATSPDNLCQMYEGWTPWI